MGILRLLVVLLFLEEGEGHFCHGEGVFLEDAGFAAVPEGGYGFVHAFGGDVVAFAFGVDGELGDVFDGAEELEVADGDGEGVWEEGGGDVCDAAGVFVSGDFGGGVLPCTAFDGA